MALDRNKYKNQILFLKGSIYDQINPDLKKEAVVKVDPEERKYALDQIKMLQKELTYITSCFVLEEMDHARVHMLLATLSVTNNLFGNVTEAAANAILLNVNSES